MTENKNEDQPQTLQRVEKESRKAVAESENIREAVRNITVKALAEGEFDPEKTKKIVAAVVKGATEGAELRGEEMQQALKEAMAGIDEALARSVEASKQAIEEAARQLEEFSSQDLKRAMDDLAALEDLFLETMKEVATKSKETAGEILHDFIRHARESGTEVGRAASQAAKTLTRELAHKVRETAAAGAKSAMKIASAISRAAAGFLEGIADTLESKTRSGENADEKGIGGKE